MSKHGYDGSYWRFENETMSVLMTDVIYQRHLTAHLASKGIDTRTYSQLLEYASRVLDQRIQAARDLADPEYWRNCSDPDVRIYIYPWTKHRWPSSLQER
jgi:hypothetical protein